MKYQRGLATALAFLGRLLLQEGDAHQAKTHFEEGLVFCRELQLVGEQAACLMGLVGVAGMSGQDERAARLFGAFKIAFEMYDFWAMSDLSHRVYDPIITNVRQRLGAAAFDAAWAEGCQMTLEEALEYNQAPTSRWER